MKFKKSTLAAVIVGGSLGIAAGSAGANDGVHGKFHSKNDGFYSKNETLTERYPKSIEDDSDMAPGVPGVTEVKYCRAPWRQLRPIVGLKSFTSKS